MKWWGMGGILHYLRWRFFEAKCQHNRDSFFTVLKYSSVLYARNDCEFNRT